MFILDRERWNGGGGSDGGAGTGVTARTVLVRQAREARTVRQVALLQHLAVSWLPRPLRQEVERALQAALILAPTGSPKSTASPKRMARST